MGWEAKVEELGQKLRKEIVDNNEEPDIERSNDLLEALTKHQGTMSIAVLQKTRLGNTMTKCIRTLKRHKRTSTNTKELETLIKTGESLLDQWKQAVDKDAKQKQHNHHQKEESEDAVNEKGLPTTVKAYQTRLTKQRKDLFKNPPVLPPNHVTIEEEWYPLPKRNKKTGELTFVCGADDKIQNLLKDFHPNRTPEEIMRAGSFGGTYYRPIASAVTNVSYTASGVLKESVDPKWIQGLDIRTMITSSTYRNSVNKYGVKCGGSLGMRESSGWIADCDPYGWFQWYCRFYQGRRCSDDARQIQRWAKSAGPKGRFRSQLCNKILAAKTTADDVSISPVIRQTLLHWGLEITEEVLAKHKKRVGR